MEGRQHPGVGLGELDYFRNKLNDGDGLQKRETATGRCLFSRTRPDACHLAQPDYTSEMAKLSLEVEVERQLLRATYSGEFSLTEGEETFHEILDAIVKDGWRN